MIKTKTSQTHSKLKNSVPKDTSNHPFRKQNSSLKQYSRKALAEKKKQNL